MIELLGCCGDGGGGCWGEWPAPHGRPVALTRGPLLSAWEGEGERERGRLLWERVVAVMGGGWLGLGLLR